MKATIIPFSIFNDGSDFHFEVDADTLKKHLRENPYEQVAWFSPDRPNDKQFIRTTIPLAIMGLKQETYNVHIYPSSSTIHIEV